MYTEQIWLALAIGNSRLHWAWFDASGLTCAWDMPHLLPEEIALLIAHQFDFSKLPDLPTELPRFSPSAPPCFWLASAVPEQVGLWQTYAYTEIVSLDRIPLGNLYPTLGIDRALAAWGAVQIYGTPVLAIDGGTALTLTGVNDRHQLVGGAILPGLRLQIQSLATGTAALPIVADLSRFPQRWATNTPDAIRSGVLHTVLAGLRSFIEAWRQEFPTSAIVLTGGDAMILQAHLQQLHPEVESIAVSPHLVLRGIQGVRDLQSPQRRRV